MIKLELSDTIKEIHKEYFRKSINFRKRIYIKETDKDNLNKILNSNYTRKDIEKIHLEFLNYCELNHDEISIGNSKDLKLIIEKINQNFPVIKTMINRGIVCKVKGEKYKKYSEVLYDIFGYSNFSGKEIKKVDSNANPNSTEREDLKNNIKNNINKFSERTLDDIIKLTYDIWRIDSDYIMKKINTGRLIEFWCAYSFVYLIDIRTCPYCNRQYITPILKKNGKMRGDLDHFLPKSKYPYLSMSIYNLIPVCKFCNTSLKGTKEFKETDLNPYEECFDDYAEFYFDVCRDNINIGIRKYDNKNDNIDNYMSIFKLKEQYIYHTKHVEELIYKRLMYSEKYVNDISRNVFDSKVSLNKINEIIIGYTSEQSKINDEPLSKFKRDIARQLKFSKSIDDDINKNEMKTLIEQLEKILDN